MRRADERRRVAIAMAVCVTCVFGMGMFGKLAGRRRAYSEKKES